VYSEVAADVALQALVFAASHTPAALHMRVCVPVKPRPHGIDADAPAAVWAKPLSAVH
jgi:hypothetical protein